jgi:acetyl-CoA carboxylase carboxyltransferase component
VGTVVLRKGYGLGAQAMAGGGFKAPEFVIGWPTAEFGAMGLEGAVRLGLRRELEAIEDPGERQAAYETAVAAAYERGQGINMAAYGEIDDVVDPADTRRWIATLFGAERSRPGHLSGKRRPHVDSW